MTLETVLYKAVLKALEEITLERFKATSLFASNENQTPFHQTQLRCNFTKCAAQ